MKKEAIRIDKDCIKLTGFGEWRVRDQVRANNEKCPDDVITLIPANEEAKEALAGVHLLLQDGLKLRQLIEKTLSPIISEEKTFASFSHPPLQKSEMMTKTRLNEAMTVLENQTDEGNGEE